MDHSDLPLEITAHALPRPRKRKADCQEDEVDVTARELPQSVTKSSQQEDPPNFASALPPPPLPFIEDGPPPPLEQMLSSSLQVDFSPYTLRDATAADILPIMDVTAAVLVETGIYRLRSQVLNRV